MADSENEETEDFQEQEPVETSDVAETSIQDVSEVEEPKSKVKFGKGQEGDAPDKTIFHSMYDTSILAPWKDEKRSKSNFPLSKKHYRTAKDATILLTNKNAEDFSNVTHIGWKGRLNYALQEYEEEKNRYIATKHEIANDPNKLLEIATATIILMAKKSKIPPEYYFYTEIYFKGITNEFGEHPPNIKKLLKHIRYLKKKNKIDWGTKAEREVPENLVVAKISKQSKIPVRLNKSVRSFKDQDSRTNAGQEDSNLETEEDLYCSTELESRGSQNESYNRNVGSRKRHSLAIRAATVPQSSEAK